MMTPDYVWFSSFSYLSLSLLYCRFDIDADYKIISVLFSPVSRTLSTVFVVVSILLWFIFSFTRKLPNSECQSMWLHGELPVFIVTGHSDQFESMNCPTAIQPYLCPSLFSRLALSLSPNNTLLIKWSKFSKACKCTWYILTFRILSYHINGFTTQMNRVKLFNWLHRKLLIRIYTEITNENTLKHNGCVWSWESERGRACCVRASYIHNTETSV